MCVWSPGFFWRMLPGGCKVNITSVTAGSSWLGSLTGLNQHGPLRHNSTWAPEPNRLNEFQPNSRLMCRQQLIVVQLKFCVHVFIETSLKVIRFVWWSWHWLESVIQYGNNIDGIPMRHHTSRTRNNILLQWKWNTGQCLEIWFTHPSAR